jgi:hypothetical protein
MNSLARAAGRPRGGRGCSRRGAIARGAHMSCGQTFVVAIAGSREVNGLNMIRVGEQPWKRPISCLPARGRRPKVVRWVHQIPVGCATPFANLYNVAARTTPCALNTRLVRKGVGGRGRSYHESGGGGHNSHRSRNRSVNAYLERPETRNQRAEAFCNRVRGLRFTPSLALRACWCV